MKEILKLRDGSHMAGKNRAMLYDLGRAAISVERIHEAILKRPIVSAGWLVDATGLSMATVNKSLIHLEALNIVQRLHEGKRNRLFVYGEYMRILESESAFPSYKGRMNSSALPKT